MRRGSGGEDRERRGEGECTFRLKRAFSRPDMMGGVCEVDVVRDEVFSGVECGMRMLVVAGSLVLPLVTLRILRWAGDTANVRLTSALRL
jgi:hypothetical protein